MQRHSQLEAVGQVSPTYTHNVFPGCLKVWIGSERVQFRATRDPTAILFLEDNVEAKGPYLFHVQLPAPIGAIPPHHTRFLLEP